MAWFDGALDNEAAAALDHHVAHCEACCAERQWLEQVRRDLEGLGDALVIRVPQIDIVDAVMGAVARAEKQPQVTPFPAPRRPGRTRPWAWAGLAAAAAMLALTWWFTADRWSLTVEPRMAKHATPMSNETPGAPSRRTPAEGFKTPDAATRAMGRDAAESLLAEAKRFAPVKSPGKQFALPDLAAITVADVLQARREGDDVGAALNQLSQWAALSPDRARALADAPGASREALVAASRALPASEARGILEKAAAQSPDDPYTRLALAEALCGQPEQYAAAARELGLLGELDPANALPDYLLARNALAAGDVDTALSAFAAAGEKNVVQSYAGSAAQFREQALVQLGVAADAALVLSALTAGADEYGSLTGLSDELVGYAKDYEAAGNLDIAQQIYEAVFRMGEQVYQGALFGIERLAGLDVQRAAVDFLDGIYTALDAQPQLQWLSTQINNLLAPIQQLASFFSGINDFFRTQVTEDNATDVAQDILQSGDISLSVRFSTPAPGLPLE